MISIMIYDWRGISRRAHFLNVWWDSWSRSFRFLLSRIQHRSFLNYVTSHKKWYMFVFKVYFNPLNANPTKWSNTLKQFVSNSQWIVWVCLTILLGWRLADSEVFKTIRVLETWAKPSKWILIVIKLQALCLQLWK